MGLCSSTLSGHTKRRTGYWTVTLVSSNYWVDWIETVDSSGEYGSDTNSGDIGARSEEITSYFWGYAAGVHNLQSRSEGDIRLKFEWIGEDPVPESITYDYDMIAQAWIEGPPGTWEIGDYYLEVWDDSSYVLGSVTYADDWSLWIEAYGSDTFVHPTSGQSVVYANAPHFINNLNADCEYGASVTTVSQLGLYVHP